MTCTTLADDCHVLFDIDAGDDMVMHFLHDVASIECMCAIEGIDSICITMTFDVCDVYGNTYSVSGSTGYDMAVDNYCQCCCMVEKVETLVCCLARDLIDETGNCFVVDCAHVCFDVAIGLDLSLLLPMFEELDIDPYVCVSGTICTEYLGQAAEYEGESHCGTFYCVPQVGDYHGIERITCDLLQWLEEGEDHCDPNCEICACDSICCTNL